MVGIVPEKETPAKKVKKEKPERKAAREEKKGEDKEPSMMAEILGVIRKRSAKKEKPAPEAKEEKPRKQKQRRRNRGRAGSRPGRIF